MAQKMEVELDDGIFGMSLQTGGKSLIQAFHFFFTP